MGIIIIDAGMNVALVFFTYAGDAELLELAVKAGPWLRGQGHAVDVYVMDDAAAPLAVPPAGCRYRQTRFERCGNLNGAECVAGMVQAYEEVFERGVYEWVVKVDADTFVNDLEWLRGVPGVFAGTVHVGDYCSGACYALKRAGVEWLRERMVEPSWRGAAQRGFCEDKVIFNMCRLSGLGVHAVRADGVPDGKLWHDWEGVRLPMAELTRAAAVDFKRCRWNSRAEFWEADRAEGLQRMREYVNFLSSYEREE